MKIQVISVAAYFVTSLLTILGETADRVSQAGIEWQFDQPYEVGQFANGDYWVVGPVTITGITPNTAAGTDGSMLNPKVALSNFNQGFDQRIQNSVYDKTLNVAENLPQKISAGSSLLSCESYREKASGDNPQLKKLVILTVVPAAPPPGTFRPPYCGDTKIMRWNSSQLNFSRLRRLKPSENASVLAQVEKAFALPWIEIVPNWTGRYLHPAENQPAYGREIAHKIAEALLLLQLDYTDAEKTQLLTGLVQYGIDIYGAILNGAVWSNDGGHNQGRKMPLLLAGLVLGDQDMMKYADGTAYKIFQEDQQTFFVTAADISRPRYVADGRPRAPYTLPMIGVPEWGEKHSTDPARDGSNWDATYRTVAGSSTIGHILAARLMGAESSWQWPAAFQYYDRYWKAERLNVSTNVNHIQPFVASMWKQYIETIHAPARLRVVK